MISDPDLLRQCHTQARAAAALLRLPFRQQRWRGQSGEQQGFGAGSSLEFQDHRSYIPGDDPRQINWQAYARTGTYTMKQYREEVRPIIDVIFDVSGSMSAFERKAQRSAELFLWAWECAHQAGAATKTYFVCGSSHRLVPDSLVAGRQWVAEASLVRQEGEKAGADASPEQGCAAALDLSRLPLRAGAMRLLVSDLLYPGAPDSIVQALTARSGRGLIFSPFAHEESHPEWEGNYEFIDPESAQRPLHRVDEDLLKSYALAYRRHFDLWKTSALKQGALLAKVPAEAALEKGLQLEAASIGAVERG
jgi:hypothetical protein